MIGLDAAVFKQDESQKRIEHLSLASHAGVGSLSLSESEGAEKATGPIFLAMLAMIWTYVD